VKLCETFEKLCVTIPKQTKRILTHQRLTKSIRVIRVPTHKTSTTDIYHIILN
jgi:transcriptional regulator of met regulon